MLGGGWSNGRDWCRLGCSAAGCRRNDCCVRGRVGTVGIGCARVAVTAAKECIKLWLRSTLLNQAIKIGMITTVEGNWIVTFGVGAGCEDESERDVKNECECKR
jgi:tetrahydromethanopterin S-methyltransferase subunit D